MDSTTNSPTDTANPTEEQLSPIDVNITANAEKEENYKLILQANEEFECGDYDKCLNTLEQLKEAPTTSINTDEKLQHNVAVVHFYKTNCMEYEKLLNSLNPLTESSYAIYNKAVIYFHRHMFRTSIKFLSPLVDVMDKLDETLSGLVSVLMLRLLLATNQLNKAHAFLDVVQNLIGINTEPQMLAADETASSPESSATIVIDDVNRVLKLLALTTNVLNRKAAVVPDDGSAEFAALKAHQYYIMKDFQMAAKQLKKIKFENYMGDTHSDELDTCIANNMGIIHLRVRHYAIAAKFFQNALAFDRKIVENLRQAPLHEISATRSSEILYNLGIAMLHLRRPKEAFQCFLLPLKTQHSNPRLWLRMAEACIMDHDLKMKAKEKKLNATLIGAKSNERPNIMLQQVHTTLYTSSGQSAAVPEPTLEFAILSLRNALLLTKTYKNNFHEVEEDEEEEMETVEENDKEKLTDKEKEDEEESAKCAVKQQNWRNCNDNNFCNPSKPITKESLDKMLAAIYAAYSYVSLRLGEYVIAFEMAQELINVEKLSGAHKMLAHMYAAEALVMLEKIPEARHYLEPSFISNLNAFDFETKDWQVKSLNAAQNIVRFNLAVATAIQGDFETAQKLLSSCTHSIVSSKVLALKMFVDLRMNS